MRRRPTLLLAATLATGATGPLAAQEPAPAGVPDFYCLQSALYMIRMAEKGLADNPDAENAPRRRGLLYEWRQRLAAGEPPCEVYREMFEAAGVDF